MIKVQTLKGFRDFLPKEIRKREYVLDILKKVFESYGFEPLETPSLEYEEILTGKYGDEGDKLMYKFKDNGERNVALRYDQTVPLSRVIAQYQNELPMPFKRYQIQNVWRAENSQKGRYREFLQVDADIVGSLSPLADAEIIGLAFLSLKKLGFSKFKILINDRSMFYSFEKYNIQAIDKLKKIGDEKVIEEMIKGGADKQWAINTINFIKNASPTSLTEQVFKVLKDYGLKDKVDFEFDPTLMRGLNYYTGIIFEIEIDNADSGSVAGGGRYNNLIGLFAGKDIPAVGFAFGFDRLIEAMEELDLFPKDLNKNNVFVAFSNSDLQEKALMLTSKLRLEGINSEYYLEDVSLEKQLKYADKKQIPYSIIVEENNLVFKDMENRTQESLTVEQVIEKLK